MMTPKEIELKDIEIGALRREIARRNAEISALKRYISELEKQLEPAVIAEIRDHLDH